MDSALEHISASLILKPDYVKALARRGYLFEETNKPHEAMRDYEEVLKLDKGHKEANAAVRVRTSRFIYIL